MKKIIFFLFGILISGYGMLFAQDKVYRVSLDGTGDGSSWNSTMSLEKALEVAQPGDRIWVRGSDNPNVPMRYVAPESGFRLKSGVKLYGGFSGNETDESQREILNAYFKMKYQTVLSGDVAGDDVIDEETLYLSITRKDNRNHVLVVDLTPQKSGNNNTFPTVVNGFSITGGVALDGRGGGIWVTGDNSGGGAYRIERCFVFENYALHGGGICVDGTAGKTADDSYINHTVVFNNMAGEIGKPTNNGGGLYLEGCGTVANTAVYNNTNGGVVLSNEAYLLNSTVVRNSVAGVDMTEQVNQDYHVTNSIIWGNVSLFDQHRPSIRYSAFCEAPIEGDEHGNIYVGAKNSDINTPSSLAFERPSQIARYDKMFDWKVERYPQWSWNLQDGSAAIDKAEAGLYKSGVFTDKDLNGTTRFSAAPSMPYTELQAGLDMGAYEFLYVTTGRVRYVKQGGNGNGTSWEDAMGDVQAAIDDLAKVPGTPGEVWIAAGEYRPTKFLEEDDKKPLSFRIREGIHVYGGFAGTEVVKTARKKVNGVPWLFEHETVLKGDYSGANPTLSWSETESKWQLDNGSSDHVVWFAPLPQDGNEFADITILDGVTITGGWANGNREDKYRTDCGAGVYMVRNAYLTNCIVKGNVAHGNGGGVYSVGGRVIASLVYNNGAEKNGGGVYMRGAGMTLRSMLTNNSAEDGAGIYMEAVEGRFPNYLILSTSVVSNNTAGKNAAVFCNQGGVVLQTTIAKNNSVGSTDVTQEYTSRTGGLYLDSYGQVINSLLWNNEQDGQKNPVYISNPNISKTQLRNCALSNLKDADWTNTWQQNILLLSEENTNASSDSELAPLFMEGLPETAGVNKYLNPSHTKEYKWYYWQPQEGSNLRGKGMGGGDYPKEVLLEPELDLFGRAFDHLPGVGALLVRGKEINPEVGADYLRVYVDNSNIDYGNDGSSWSKPYSSVTDALAYLAALTPEQVNGKRLEVYLMEGAVIPYFAAYDFDSRSRTLYIPQIKSGAEIWVRGGFSRTNLGEWNPDKYRTVIDGNPAKISLNQGHYHCITVGKNVRATIEGLHISKGYAVSKAMVTSGAGILVDDGADVTLNRCVLEGNTARQGAVIDGSMATVKMVNCVVHNNEVKDSDGALIRAKELTMQFCSWVNNVGIPVDRTTTVKVQNSFLMGAGSTDPKITGLAYFTEQVDRDNFENPTSTVGPQLQHQTVTGNYPLFRPTNSNPCVNQGTSIDGINEDMNGNPRSMGGKPDLGAYEATLPADGETLYVRTTGNDDNSGISWQDAFATIGKALTVAKNKNGEVKAIWVSAGVYEENLTMVEGVNVLGGFCSTGNPNNALDGINRDLSHTKTLFKTVIKNVKPLPTEIRQQSTAYTGEDLTARVLTQPRDFTASTLWEGFILTGGKSFLMNYGAGALVRKGGHLKNCRIDGNIYYESSRNLLIQSSIFGTFFTTVYKRLYNNDAESVSGGGVCCLGGTVENCQIVNNQIQGGAPQLILPKKWEEGNRYYRFEQDKIDKVYAKGAGLGISGGDIINCVIARNVVGWHDRFYKDLRYESASYGKGGNAGDITNILGCAVFVATKSNFYNCTIVENGGGWERPSNPATAGVWDEAMKDNVSNAGSRFYNCILAGNYACGNTWENVQQIGAGLDNVPNNLLYCFLSYINFTEPQGRDKNIYANIRKEAFDASKGNKHQVREILMRSGTDRAQTDEFWTIYQEYGLLDENYNLNPQVELGAQNPCWNTGRPGYVDGTEGIVIELDANGYARTQDCVVDMGAYELSSEGNVAHTNNVFYVTQNGKGLRNGTRDNPACADKLQDILTYAGRLVSPTVRPVVKIAGGIYRPVVMSNVDNPQQRATFTVPFGVQVMGGYDELTGNWDKENRKVDGDTKTVLSAEVNYGRGTVNGWHVLSFEKRKDGFNGKGTLVDGIFLQDGKAMATGDPVHSCGGGAVVPDGVHIRNCVVQENEASAQGGGLYLEAGALVTGTLICGNKAALGGGVYADSLGVTRGKRVHMYASTVADNEAGYVGGGFYMEEGAAMVMSSVFFGNKASNSENVGGAGLWKQYADDMTDRLWITSTGSPAEGNLYYVFNNCAVETYDMPGNLPNNVLQSDGNIYFGSEWRLRPYSPLVKTGVEVKMHQYMQENWEVSPYDMQGYQRMLPGATRVDNGAFAHEGGVIGDDQHIRRIFVSKTNHADVSDYGTDMGRSFYTPLNSLDAAVEYINRERQKGITAIFEIWVAEGVYKPTVMRKDAAAELSGRTSSFVIPAGVRIFGGFSGREKAADNGVSQALVSQYGLERLPEGTIGLQQVEKYLNEREMADHNGNGLLEPWELKYQTVLSGNINIDPAVKNAYHVLYSKQENTVTGERKKVLLDGVSVVGGETHYKLGTDKDEMGRGGAIYSHGVDYLCYRCRFRNNKAVRGGAIYARVANVTTVGCEFEGNGTVSGASLGDENMAPCGGAVYLTKPTSDISQATYTFRAVNTLFANNETSGYGGALTVFNVNLDLMNNTLVRNKAGRDYGAVYAKGTHTGWKITNTAVWGNDGGSTALSSGMVCTYTASDDEMLLEGEGNVKLGKENMLTDGPRFEVPTAVAGLSAVSGKWNPVAISVLTDTGNGTNEAGDVYNQWFVLPDDPTFINFRREDYMGAITGANTTPIKRHTGRPFGPTAGMDRIDIGLYEYQYPSILQEIDTIYVALKQSGEGNGTDWNNATSDLQGALYASCNPKSQNLNRVIYVEGGEYVGTAGGAAAFNIGRSVSEKSMESLTVYGGCTKVGHTQDFSQPTVFKVNPDNRSTSQLLEVDIDKPVVWSGFAFEAANLKVSTSSAETVALALKGTSAFTLKNCELRHAGVGLNCTGSNKVKLVNILFADNQYGLRVTNVGNVTIVNNTFVNNRVEDMTAGITGVYNTLSCWNGKQHVPSANKNVVIPKGISNTDSEQGPNFLNPDQGDYRVRPSMKLTGQGDDKLYLIHVGISEQQKADERELANAPRFVGVVDVGAYEFASELKQVVYVKKGVSSDYPDGSSWSNPMSDLQAAIDLASVYARLNADKTGFVLVHGNVKETTPIVVKHNVTVYGSLSDTDDVTVNRGAPVFVRAIGLLGAVDCSELADLEVSSGAVVDGFKVNGATTIGQEGMLSTSWVKGAVDGVGILYNVLAEQTVTGVKAVCVTGLQNLPENTVASRASAETNAYVANEGWNYQLNDSSGDINATTIDEQKEVDKCIEKVNHRLDLAGNMRVRDAVDRGCFETWFADKSKIITVSADDYPHGKSVVYIAREGGLNLVKEYDELNPFCPGFLLLGHNASLWSNGKHVALDNFAQERVLEAVNGYEDLAAVPFVFGRIEVDGKEAIDNLKMYFYDGAERAAYSYKFEESGTASNGEPTGAWKLMDGSLVRRDLEGMLLIGRFTDDIPHTVRFYGNEYRENGKHKPIYLYKFNFSEPWNANITSNRFTHKENMSWNFVGSPYLCQMKLEDMDNQHVVYVQEGMGYKTHGLSDGQTVLPAGTGIMTQTATLREREEIVVRIPELPTETLPSPRRLAVQLISERRDRADELTLNPVEAADAVQEFRVNHDGVKWMSADSIPQLYALGDGGRYSLLSAVDREGFVPVGIRVPYAGRYTMQLSSDCEWGDCEAVVLIDDKLQRTVDLTEGSYSFDALTSGEENGRFRISFLRSAMTDDGSGVRVYSTQRGTITVDGLQSGYQVRVFTPSGMQVRQLTARQWQETFSCPAENVCLVRVDDAEGKNICVRKVRL